MTVLKMPPHLQSYIIHKRTFSEILPDDESRQSKKHRKELEILTSDDKTVAKSNIHNDSKRKRKKRRKRKSPLINPDIEIHSFQQVPESMITEVPGGIFIDAFRNIPNVGYCGDWENTG